MPRNAVVHAAARSPAWRRTSTNHPISTGDRRGDRNQLCRRRNGRRRRRSAAPPSSRTAGRRPRTVGIDVAARDHAGAVRIAAVEVALGVVVADRVVKNAAHGDQEQPGQGDETPLRPRRRRIGRRCGGRPPSQSRPAHRRVLGRGPSSASWWEPIISVRLRARRWTGSQRRASLARFGTCRHRGRDRWHRSDVLPAGMPRVDEPGWNRLIATDAG